MLTTYNRCQTFTLKRLEELPMHEEYLKQLQVRWQENELGIQLVKSLDEKVLKTVISQEVVSNHLLEDRLCLIPARVANIKAQVSKHEITIRFLEPSGFETIATDANICKQFINDVAGST